MDAEPALAVPASPVIPTTAERGRAGPAREAAASAAATGTLPDQVRSFFAYTPSALASNLAGALVVALTQWPSAPRASLLGWLAAFGVVWLARLLLAQRFARAEPRDAAAWRRWWRHWNAAALLSGAMWGLAALLLIGERYAAPQIVLILIIATLSVGAAPVLAQQPALYRAYAALAMLPLVLRIALLGGAEHAQVAAVLALIFVLMMVLGRNYHFALDRLIELKAHTEQLAEQLRREKAAADAARREAEIANRAKTQFFAAASHDLRQPLHALGLFAEALRARSRDDVQAVQLVNSINASVDALDGLFAELLDLTKIEAGGVAAHPEHFAIAALFRRFELHFQPAAFDKGLELRFRGSQHHACADPLLVERIVRNLLANAIRYTDDGGVLVAARRRGDRLLMQVWDSGIGIDASQQEHVFDEFYQIAAPKRLAAHQRKGLGLGLAIVKRLAGLMDAPLTLRSQPGRGSVFTLELPLGRATPAAREAEAALRGGAPRVALDGRRVLVVEDEPAVRSGLVVLLRSWGAQPIAFADAAECLDWAELAAQAPPDLLIVDHRLDGGPSGVDVIDVLRRRFARPRLPAIVVTGSLMFDHEEQARAHDFHLLVKPVVPSRLRAMIGFKLGLGDAIDDGVEKRG